MAVDAQRFRELFGSYPTSVSVVTTVDADGTPRGLTCNAMTAVSAAPPMLLVCVDRNSQSLSALRHSGAFVVHVLAENGRTASDVFASKADAKFEGLRWRPAALAGGAPVLADVALAHAECRIVQHVEAGDHWILVARVEAAEVYRRRPLLYQRGTYSVWHQETELAATHG
ncbi:flavin reductase family protein [Streptomyces sp. NPDC013157]|uniref:flavin reductase family protein n=1 Tax=Streptomyces sp. NPDC013157 TaxID=3364861 RepID=UPI0036BB5FA9